ncbi:hypothetical protein LX32DRAFT_646915 [Colletotrichum zoysiae]|uniref:Uncharacterized protein n=1 Tax=Colletotrichum zoysiae TaxID=1216348 RepID=A0AAD9LUJ6_9PEZI|nr:hypothetical protein LX32DRAFT_646915 [Colletotrichum zoysiae]
MGKEPPPHLKIKKREKRKYRVPSAAPDHFTRNTPHPPPSPGPFLGFTPLTSGV